MEKFTQDAVTTGAMQILAEAELSFGFIHGSGLGALMLAIIALVFLFRPPFFFASLSVVLERLWPSK